MGRYNYSLDDVTLNIPVIDLAHVGPTLVNLAAVRASYPVTNLNVVISVDPTKFPGTDPNDSAAVQKIIDDATDRLTKANQKLQASFPKQPQQT